MLGWLDDRNFRESQAAPVDQLARFHDRDYIGALRASEAAGKVEPEIRERYNLGNRENPVFAGLFERAATAVGGSILAAKLAMECGLAYHPSGGTHHGRPDRASGFCYFNDPVFAIAVFLERAPERVLYVDLDAHHGDGVQDAFADDERVFTCRSTRTRPSPAAPRTTGRRAHAICPCRAVSTTASCEYLMDERGAAAGPAFAPDAVVVTCGADGLAGDPLSAMELSNVPCGTRSRA